MVDSKDIAVAGGIVGGAYLLSRGGFGGGGVEIPEGPTINLPGGGGGIIPIPSPGAGGELPSFGDAFGEIFEQQGSIFAGILEAQGQRFQATTGLFENLLQGEIARSEQQTRLFENLLGRQEAVIGGQRNLFETLLGQQGSTFQSLLERQSGRITTLEERLAEGPPVIIPDVPTGDGGLSIQDLFALGAFDNPFEGQGIDPQIPGGGGIPDGAIIPPDLVSGPTSFISQILSAGDALGRQFGEDIATRSPGEPATVIADAFGGPDGILATGITEPLTRDFSRQITSIGPVIPQGPVIPEGITQEGVTAGITQPFEDRLTSLFGGGGGGTQAVSPSLARSEVGRFAQAAQDAAPTVSRGGAGLSRPAPTDRLIKPDSVAAAVQTPGAAERLVDAGADLRSL